MDHDTIPGFGVTPTPGCGPALGPLRNPRYAAIQALALATGARMTGPTPPADPPADPPKDPPADPPADPPKDPPADPPKPPSADDFVKQGQALERERSLRRDAEKRAKENEKAQERVEELENAGKTEAEQAAAKARREGIQEANQKANGRLIRSEARALAGEAKFRDPQMVVRLLDLDDIAVTDDGEVDSEAITKQLEKLKTDQPYLLVDDKPTQQQPKPDPTQGPRGGKTSGTDVGREMFQKRRGGKSKQQAEAS